MTDEQEGGDVFAFRTGSRNYPSGVKGPFATREEARAAAQHERNMGGQTGRIVRTTIEQFEKDRKDLSWGRLPKGY